jgi:hypothetical protein
MDLTTIFVGLCMIDRKDSAGDGPITMYLPRADRDGYKHVDGTPARMHYAYLLLPEVDVESKEGEFEVVNGKIRERLNRTDIRFRITGGPRKLIRKELRDVVRMTEIAEDIQLRPEADPSVGDASAARIELEKGRFSVMHSPRSRWSFAKTLKQHDYRPEQLTFQILWTVPGIRRAEIEIVHYGAKPVTKRLTLKRQPGSRIDLTIGNVCEPDPDKWESLPPEECKDPGGCTDHDFKWFYELFTPNKGIAWADRLKGGPAPAPHFEPPPAMARGITTPTCFPAEWRGDE